MELDEESLEELKRLGIPTTEEEIKKRKEESAKELAKKGFLPKNDEFNPTRRSSQEDVEKNPKQYIIKECIPACQELWKKNIYTFMVSDHHDEGECWIEISGECLSEENMKILKELNAPIKFCYHEGCYNFGVNKVGLEGQKELLELAKQFKMQDVVINHAYITKERFLMNYCACYDEIPNPNYREMKEPWTLSLEPDELIKYMDEYDKWEDSEESKKTLHKYNPSKATKPLEELVKEHNMVLEGDRIYLSQFHYDKHQNYIKSKELNKMAEKENNQTPENQTQK